MASSSPGQLNSREGRGGGWAIWAAVAIGLAGLWIGHQALALHRVNWDGLAAEASAYRVLNHGARPSLSEIGFARPPLVALMMTAVGWADDSLLRSGEAGMLLGIASLVIAAAWAISFMLRLGLADWLAALVAILFFGNPLVLSLYVGGSPSAHYFTLTVIGLGALAMWMAEMKLRDLLAASVALGLAGLCDHLGLIVAAAATVAVAVRKATAEDGGEPLAPGRKGGRCSAAQGAALLFAMVPAYFYGLWVLAAWAIVGKPFESWHEWFQGTLLHLVHPDAAVWVTIACGGWLGAILLALAVRTKELRPAAVATVGIAAAAALLPTAGLALLLNLGRSGPGPGPDWASVASLALMVKAAVLVTLVVVLAEVRRGGWLTGGGVVLRVVGVVVFGIMVAVAVDKGLGGRWPANFGDLAAGNVGVTGDYGQAQQVAPLISWLLEAKHATEVRFDSTRTPAFAVALAAGDMKRVGRVRDELPRAGMYQVFWQPQSRPRPAHERWPLAGHPAGKMRFILRWGEYSVWRSEVAAPAKRGR